MEHADAVAAVDQRMHTCRHVGAGVRRLVVDWMKTQSRTGLPPIAGSKLLACMPLAGSILARSRTVVPMSIVEPSASVRFG